MDGRGEGGSEEREPKLGRGVFEVGAGFLSEVVGFSAGEIGREGSSGTYRTLLLSGEMTAVPGGWLGSTGGRFGSGRGGRGGWTGMFCWDGRQR